MAIIGTALAPAALLGIPYMSADNSKGKPDLKHEFRKAVINLGVIFGCYAMFVIIAGGFALQAAFQQRAARIVQLPLGVAHRPVLAGSSC